MSRLEHVAAAIGIGLMFAGLSIPITGDLNWRAILHTGLEATAGALGLGAYNASRKTGG